MLLMKHVIIYGLFNDAVSSSDYATQNSRMVTD